jgi:malate dehydrogenase (oxaloacetate-decarboxylating)(NADP+)
MARELDPNIMIDGPMQADTALIPDIQNKYPFMELDGAANVLICPNLTSANIAYKLLDHLGDAEMTGPILEGMAKPVQILQQGDGVRQVVHMAAICAVDAQRLELERL